MPLSGNISGSPAKFYDDYVFKAQALPNAAAITSAAVLGGQTQDAIEYVFEAIADIVLGSGVTKGLKIEVLASATANGTFAVVDTPLIVASAEAAKTLSAGEFLRYAPTSNVGPYLQFRVTATGDLSASSINVYPAYVPR